MAQKKRVEQPLIRSAALEYRAVEGVENQYEISFSSETPYTRWGLPEILSHDADAVDLSRFASGGPMLFAHGVDPNYGKVPIGKVVRAWLDEPNRKCRAIIEFDSADESCTRLQAKLDKGMLSGVSVGYRVGAYLELKAGQTSPNGRFTGPADIAVKWSPHEISLEPIPADPNVGLGKSIENEEDNAMSLAVKNEDGVQTAAVTVPAETGTSTRSVPAAVTSAVPVDLVAAERTRALEIGSLCRSFHVDAQTATGYIEQGITTDAVRAAILERMQAGNAPLRMGIGADVMTVADEGDKLRDAAADGLLLRSGVTIEKPAAGALSFRGMSLQQIAVECLTRSGVADANRMDKNELFRRSMTPDSAFSAIASNVANRVVLSAHETAPTTFQLWTSKGNAVDFRPTEFYEISEAGDLEEVPQNGELKEAKLSDKSVAVRRMLTFGKKITFTRQLFINDDIELVTRTLTKFALAFQRGTNRTVYELLRKNPTMYDGQALFSAAHGNLGIGAAPSTESFAEARKKMRTQKDLGGEAFMNISPAFILSSAADETAIEKLLTSLADPSGSNSGVANVFRNRMTLVVDAELDVDTGAQPYYFAADPRMADTVEVAYLNGNESPIVESKMGFDDLGIQFRVYGDRGVTLLDYKGLHKNSGK